MDLIFIYGPPAVGKLTTAKKLAEKIKYKIFHNHLAADLVHTMFESFTEKAYELRMKIQNMVLEYSSESGLDGLIFTYCYAYPDDNNIIEQIESIISKHNGKIIYVMLQTDLSTLKSRVINEDRKQFKKLINPDKLETALIKWNLIMPILKNNNLLFDNSLMSCEDVCSIIVEYIKEFNLENFKIKNLTIREAVQKDAISIKSLHRLSGYLLCKEHYTIVQLDSWLLPRIAERYYDAINNKQIYIAEYNRRIVGFLNVKQNEISQLFVHPDYIKKGVGKELLNFGINKANMASKTIRLLSTLNAISFYKKFGFKELGIKEITRGGMKLKVVDMLLDGN